MGRRIKTVLARLGAVGLAQVLDDLFDTPRLVRLANACGLSYPGMRTQSQKRERIVADLAARALSQEAARREIDRALRKEIAAPLRAWRGRSEDERARLLADPAALRAERSLGVALYLGASAAIPGIDDAAVERMLAALGAGGPAVDEPAAAEAVEPLGATEDGDAHRELVRLHKRHAELARKVRHLEGQLAKARDTEKLLRRDVIERKGELAESRMLAERLRKELDGARAASGARAGQGAEDVAQSVRKLLADQRKLAHAVAKVGASVPPEIDLSPVLASLEALRAEIAAAGESARGAATRDRRALGEMTVELRALAAKLDEVGERRPKRSAPRPSSPPRVGVFVDVQNVFYGARRLKGKLDFDALLAAAVRDRRLILARAYVVESKDIDQSGFIALLQHKAFEVRRKPLQVRADGSMKGDWDMEMALDMLDEAPNLDVVVLVSGDGDFTSLVRRVRSIGPRVEVFGFPRTTAKALIEVADQFHPLDRRFMIRAQEVTEDEAETRAS